MAFVAIAAAVIAAASSIQQGRVASANAKSQANYADYNAKVSENNATISREQAVANEESQRRQAGLQLGRMRAGIAESGGGLSGTSGDLYSQSLAASDLDAKNILYMGDLKGMGLESDASLQRSSASMYRDNASAIRSGSYLSAAGKAFASYGSYAQSSSLSTPGQG